MILLSISFVAITIILVLLLFHRLGLLDAFNLFSKDKLKLWHNILIWLGSFLLFLAFWDIISRLEPEGVNKIPGPIQTLGAALRLVASGKLIEEALISCFRVLVGFMAASVIGVSIGLVAGSFLLANRLIVPVNSFLRYIPPTAFISLLIVYFGIGESYKYAVIFLGVIFFIIQMVIDVVDDIDKRYFEMALTTGYGNLRIFKEVVMPASWPRIVDVLRINLSASWTFLVAAELIGAEKGLGHLISVSQRFLRIDELYVCILTFGLIGIATDRVIDLGSRKIFRWHHVNLKQ